MKMILILGCARSGTSALAGSLAQAGVFFGNHLYPADKKNPKGYFESKHIATFNQKVLQELNMRWCSMRRIILPDMLFLINKYCSALVKLLKEDYTQPGIACIKCVRTARLLPLYREALRRLEWDVEYIYIQRDFEKTYLSLRNMRRLKRKCYKHLPQFIEDEILAGTNKKNCCHVQFETLLMDPAREIKRVCDFLDIPFKNKEKIEEFIDPNLVTVK